MRRPWPPGGCCAQKRTRWGVSRWKKSQDSLIEKLCVPTYLVIYKSHTVKGKGKRSRYRPGVAQRVGIGIALLFRDLGTRREWVVSSTPRPHFTPGKDLVPILQETGWARGPVCTDGKSRPHQDSIPDRPDLSSVTISTELPGPQISYYCYVK